MTPRESEMTRAFDKYVSQARNVKVYPLIANQFAPLKWPDRLYSHKAFGLVLIEWKYGENWLDLGQLQRAQELERVCVGRFTRKLPSIDQNSPPCVQLFSIDASKQTGIFVPRDFPEQLNLFCGELFKGTTS